MIVPNHEWFKYSQFGHISYDWPSTMMWYKYVLADRPQILPLAEYNDVV